MVGTTLDTGKYSLTFSSSGVRFTPKPTKRQLALGPQPVVVPVVPEVEFRVLRPPVLLVLLLLQRQELGPLRLADRLELLLQVVEERHDRFRILGHFHLLSGGFFFTHIEDIVGERVKAEDVGHLAPEPHNLLQQRHVLDRPRLVAHLRAPARLGHVRVPHDRDDIGCLGKCKPQHPP